MWAITSYYNPAHYSRRLTNYRIFRENLGIPLVTVELSFDGNFQLTKNDADVLIQISGGAVIWQKERLLNVAFKSVPAHENVAWIDCDLIFERPDWAEAANEQLGEFSTVQLFSEVVDLDRDCVRLTADCRNAPASGQGAVSLVREQRADIAALLGEVAQARSKCVGFAWAGRRQLLDEHGLYDAMVIGGGVRTLIAAMYGQQDTLQQVYRLNPARHRHYVRWARPYHQAVGGRVGFIAGRLFHLWHGEGKNRKYSERHRWFSEFDFDPDADLVVGANGAWAWARPRPDLEQFFSQYFSNRAEDG